MTEALDDGPFFHGTTAAMQSGELLAAGFRSNYRPEIIMNHIYFTALVGTLSPSRRGDHPDPGRRGGSGEIVIVGDDLVGTDPQCGGKVYRVVR